MMKNLFKKIADDYVHEVQCDNIAASKKFPLNEEMDLTFLNERGVVHSQVRIKRVSCDSGYPLVSVHTLHQGKETGDWAFVSSDKISALIAVCCR